MPPFPSSETTSFTDEFVKNGLPPIDEWPQLSDALGLNKLPHGNFTNALLKKNIDQGRYDATALMRFDGCLRQALSYCEPADRVARLDHVLVDDAGLRQGQRVLMRGPNSLMMAVLRASGVAVTAMPLLRAKELQQVVEKANISLALCDARCAAELQSCRNQLQAKGAVGLLSQLMFFHIETFEGMEQRKLAKSDRFDAFPCDLVISALIAFTSGTTGTPKGTVHFHRNLFAICETFSRNVLELRADDRCCGSPPLVFTFGLGGLLCFPLCWGAAGILSDKPGTASLLKQIEHCQVTVVFKEPTMFRQMLPLLPQVCMASLFMSVSAGEALPQTTRAAWSQATGLEMVDGLGSTVILHVFILCKSDQHRAGAIGRAVPGYEIAVLAVRGVTGSRYLKDERHKTYVQQGWNLPGDVGYVNEDNYFHYVVRSDDLIVSAGYNISNIEVEEAILSHPEVAGCAVIGIPDEIGGQIVQAHVVLRAPVAGDELLAGVIQEQVNAHLAPFKYPRPIFFVFISSARSRTSSSDSVRAPISQANHESIKH